MTREEAIKHLEEWVEVISIPSRKKAVEIAIAALQDDWIPVSERLPEVGQDVLASVHVDYAEHAVIINRYEEQPSWSNGIITAWRPLPEPYKAESEEV